MSTIRCENCYCAYFLKSKCVLDSVNLDTMGMCAECVNVQVPERILNKLRYDFLLRTDFLRMELEEDGEDVDPDEDKN